MFTPPTILRPFSYLYYEVKNNLLYKFYSVKWNAQYCTICNRKMDLYYYLLFNVHIANKHTANVIYSCPNNCKKIFGRANKKDILLSVYEYKIDKYRLTYINSKDQKPSKILLSIRNINSHIPFFDLEKMTKNDIIKRVNRLVPFI